MSSTFFFFYESDVGKGATHMKSETNKTLSYYKNNLTALKTQRGEDEKAVPQSGR